ncbi:hypothetical protein BT96DRAFT_616846 [Gymnopus androsaceus JB14]|uniref:F-box domain-containing protein n=1 Tax=Gymnopus androsaceus JB14 TaxID=1447944 RepID=A0A6A4HVW5_9AGAR|nr:hypothetical protein BT96DRAFT_616846 [Gymnopus androsaceus JB14]
MIGLAQSIPPELKRHIAGFCKPAELANLALVNTSYRDEAEVLLYRKISVWFEPKRLSIWDTLKTHSHKAALVRSLTIKFEPNYYAHTLAAESICTALVNTRGLLELCLHLLEEDVAFQAQIQALLRQRYFNLEIFHCSGYFDLPTIVDSQSNSLQILATCDHWNTLSAFQDIARRYPSLKLFSYEQFDYTTSVFNILNIFPALYPNNTFLWDPISKSYNCHDKRIR